MSTHRHNKDLPQVSKSHTMRLASVWAVAAVAQISLAWAAVAQESENIFFHENYNLAIREAKLTQKPIFLEFRCAP
jgi:hypothetical protein